MVPVLILTTVKINNKTNCQRESSRCFIFVVLFFHRKFLGQCIKENIKMNENEILKQFFYI